MSAHTPAPWDAISSNVFAKATAALIATANRAELAGYDAAEMPPHIQAEIAANVRLMKTAPDLLEALTDAVAALEMVGKLVCIDGVGAPASTSVLGMAKAAIAKARAA